MLRIEPGIMYVAPLLVMAPRMSHVMDKVQASWARDILGCRGIWHIKHHSLRVLCGWDLRLSSKVHLAAIMALSRLQLLPSDHPGARMLALAWDVPCLGWVAVVKDLMRQPSLGGGIPDLLSYSGFTISDVQAARSSKDHRKALLKRYRNAVVAPALRERDQRLYLQSASSVITSLGWTYSSLLPAPELPSYELLDFDFELFTWRFYRVWAIIRITGSWPLTCYGGSELPESLPVCPLCAACNVSVVHCFWTCPVTLPVYTDLTASVHVTSRQDTVSLIFAAFGPGAGTGARVRLIEFVGRCVHAVLGRTQSAGQSVDAIQAVEPGVLDGDLLESSDDEF